MKTTVGANPALRIALLIATAAMAQIGTAPAQDLSQLCNNPKFQNSPSCTGNFSNAGSSSGELSLTVLRAFTGADGAAPSSLTQGADGNFYGTTEDGGSNGVGTVFRVAPSGTFTTLYSFAGVDGDEPASLITGTDGNFYGVAAFGGGDFGGTNGTVFRITSAGVFTNLHSFSTDGDQPSSLIQGADGNFYGVTRFGGTNDAGTVFRITPAGTLTTLHSFSAADGALESALTQGADGNLYGVTAFGGATGDGAFFRLTPAGDFTTLQSFAEAGGGGVQPSTLIQATDGNFYGATDFGGDQGAGTIFRVTASGTLTTLHSFSETDGALPIQLIQGSDGNLYGASLFGGPNDAGTLFRLTLSGVLTSLYSFGGADGAAPRALLRVADGALFGTAATGGSGSAGTVFKLAQGSAGGNAGGGGSGGGGGSLGAGLWILAAAAFLRNRHARHGLRNQKRAD